MLSILNNSCTDVISTDIVSDKDSNKKNEKVDNEKLKELNKVHQDLLTARDQIFALKKELASLQEDKIELQGNLQASISEKKKNISLLVDLRNQCDSLQKKNRELLKQNNEYHSVTEEFEETLQYYKLYCSLPASTQKRFKTIINSKKPLYFLVSVSDKDNILALWDDIKYRIDDIDEKEIELLVKLMDYFLKLVNINFKTPVYELMLSETGKQFDEERHIRSTNCSKYQGKIERVLLPGIWNYNKQEAERKTIVEYT
jgi:chromosome segregation ATPase